jgi:hypothetical protein
MRPLLPAVLLAIALPAAHLAAQAPEARLTLDFVNPGLNPSHWVLTLAPDGSGHFRSQRNPAPAEPSQTLDAPEVDRPIQVEAAFAARLFATAGAHKLFQEKCEANLKVAFQGWKTLSYSGPEGEGSCRFNYSRDRQIAALVDSLIALASTILEGARLEMLLQHDRLGLDRELEYVASAAADDRMIQFGVMRGILERISEDPGVMERVRKRARQLLAGRRE